MFCGDCGTQVHQPVQTQYHQPMQQQPILPQYHQQIQQQPIQPHEQPYHQSMNQHYQPQPHYSHKQNYTSLNSNFLYEKYKKLGGWLLFFVVYFIIGLVMSIIATLISSPIMFIYGSTTGYAYIAILSTIVSCALSILLIVQLCTKKSTFLRIYQLSVIIGISLSLIQTLFGSFGGFGGFGGSVLLSILFSLIPFFLMTLYFCKSIRVRVYMGNDEYMSKAIFAFKNQPPL